MNRVHFLLLCLLGLQLLTTAPEKITAAPSQAPVDYRFGVIESYENPDQANALGAAWTRVRFQWAETQAGGPGTWTASVSDAQINNEIAAGRTVVGLLIGIPDWARENNLPRGLNLPYTDPNNSWATFVREAVSRYNGRINNWIIWNEPDVNDPNAPGYTWGGSVQDFFQLQRTAYLVAKEVNPNVTIHLSAFTYFWNPNYIYDYLDVVVADPAAAENNYYFDALTAHLYFQPDSIFNIIQQFYGAVASRGIPWKPVWLVETNAPPTNDPAWPVPNWTFQVTQQEQAAFIPQVFAVGLAAGAQRIAIYKLQDTPGDVAANPEPFGLVRMDGSRRPAFTTYQVATQYLTGMQGVKREVWGYWGQIRLDQGSQATTVLFSRLPAPQVVDVVAEANTAVLVDMWGSRQTISASNGVFTVTLPGAICAQTAGDFCMIGGPVYYLVQATDGVSLPAPPPVSAPPPVGTPIAVTNTPVPSSTPQDTATPLPSPTYTATATASATATSTAVPTQTATATPTVTATIEPTASQTAVPTPSPTPLLPETAETDNRSFIFLGIAGLVALVIGGWWWNGRKKPPGGSP
jgi:polysaccharide biosynthesis protein PslG